MQETATRMEQHPLSLWQRLWGVLVSPRRTFPEIVAQAEAKGVVLAVLTLSFLAALSTLPKLKAFALWQLSQGPDAIPADRLAGVQGFATTAALTEILVTALVIPFTVWMAGAGLLKILSRRGVETVPFNKFLAITVFAYVPRLLADILRAALIAVSPFQKVGFIGTNLAALLPSAELGLVGVVLRHIDPFTLWALGLFSCGGALALRAKPRHIAMLAYSLWFIYLIVVLI